MRRRERASWAVLLGILGGSGWWGTESAAGAPAEGYWWHVSLALLSSRVRTLARDANVTLQGCEGATPRVYRGRGRRARCRCRLCRNGCSWLLASWAHPAYVESRHTARGAKVLQLCTWCWSHPKQGDNKVGEVELPRKRVRMQCGIHPCNHYFAGTTTRETTANAPEVPRATGAPASESQGCKGQIP